MSPTATTMGLMQLPPEIRNNIYSYLLHPAASRRPSPEDNNLVKYDFMPALQLFYVNKQVYQEAKAVFSNLNTFVVVETPWAEALNHVANEGKVPIVSTGYPGWTFNLWTLRAQINAPQWTAYDDQHLSFAIHVDDLPAFATTWRYSDLSEPLLNPQLSLNLTMQDPKRRGDWEEPNVPKAVQQRLLLPFAIVKRLHSVTFDGEPKPLKSVTDKLLQGMKEPHESPESCLRSATQYKELGNVALKTGKYDEALEMYNNAWLAMHIVITGNERQVYADAHFNRELKEEPFKGMQGPTVRLALRVKLVANTVMLYLKMKRWEDAKIWGMRTIDIIRSAIGLPENYEAARPEDEAVMNFVGADDMGKIYFRTAMAWKALDDKAEARKLLRVAEIYLPRDRRVKEELAACSLRLG